MQKAKTILLLAMAGIFLAGCSSLKQLRKDYKLIVWENGINEYEAATIAQMHIVKSIYESYYYNFPATIRQDEPAQKYPDYWFVDFSPKLTYDAPSYLVAINKKTGDILYNDPYNPRREPGLDWLFD